MSPLHDGQHPSSVACHRRMRIRCLSPLGPSLVPSASVACRCSILLFSLQHLPLVSAAFVACQCPHCIRPFLSSLLSPSHVHPSIIPSGSVACPHSIRQMSPLHPSLVPAASVACPCRISFHRLSLAASESAYSIACPRRIPSPWLDPAPCPRRVRCLFLSLRPLTPPAGTARPVRQLDLLQHGLHCSPGRFELYTPYMCIIQTSASILKCMTLCLPHPSPCSYNVLESKLVRRSRQARLTTTAPSPPSAGTDSDTRT